MHPSAAPPPALAAHGVVRRFRGGLFARAKVALHGVDLAVARGAALGLVGPNGSGKSTLMRLFAGVDVPTRGAVEVSGLPAASPEARARTAYLPEDSPFPGELSARAALALLAALAGLDRRTARARGAELLERVGLTEAAGRPLAGFSRGMLRRFGLAQAFLAEPEVVLLDEPTAGLDAEGFGVLDGLLAEARARGATTVLASHLLADVHAHCDQLTVLAAGRVAAAGPPATLLAAEGRLRLDVEGLTGAGVAALEAWLAGRGARVVGAAPGGRTLAELYRAEVAR